MTLSKKEGWLSSLRNRVREEFAFAQQLTEEERKWRSEDRWKRHVVACDDKRAWTTKSGSPRDTMAWEDMDEVFIFYSNLLYYELNVFIFTDRSGRKFYVDHAMVGFYEFQFKANLMFPGFSDVVSSFAYDTLGEYEDAPPIWLDLKVDAPVKIRREPGPKSIKKYFGARDATAFILGLLSKI